VLLRLLVLCCCCGAAMLCCTWVALTALDGLRFLQYTPEVGVDRAAAIRGTVIAMKNKNMDSSFRILNAIEDDLYEAQYPWVSPLLKDVKILQKWRLHDGHRRSRRAKLYYLKVRTLRCHARHSALSAQSATTSPPCATACSSFLRHCCASLALMPWCIPSVSCRWSTVLLLPLRVLQDKPIKEFIVSAATKERELLIAERAAKRAGTPKKKVVKKG
jgi:ribosomal protein L19